MFEERTYYLCVFDSSYSVWSRREYAEKRQDRTVDHKIHTFRASNVSEASVIGRDTATLLRFHYFRDRKQEVKR